MLKLNLNETMRDYQVAADEDWQGCGETAARLLEQVPVLVDELRTARAEVVGFQEHGKDLVNILQEMQAELREARAEIERPQALEPPDDEYYSYAELPQAWRIEEE